MTALEAPSGNENTPLLSHRKDMPNRNECSASPFRQTSSRRRFLKKSAAGLLGALAGSSVLAGCDFLEPEVRSQLAPGNFLVTEQGLVSTLGSAYAETQIHASYRINNVSDWTTDIAWETGGGINRTAVPLINFTWGSSGPFFRSYNPNYRGIRDVHLILENLDEADVSEAQKALLRAEARFIRAAGYVNLYMLFGPVPLRTSTQQKQELPRATEEEMQSFIEEEFLAVIPALPEPGQQPAYGRATNGAARGLLTKFYLNTKQWQKAANMAQEVISMGAYGLYPDHLDMFKVKNEGNEEMIWVYKSIPERPGVNYMNGAFPPQFEKHPRTGLTMRPGWPNWAAQFRLRDGFVNSFEEGDERKRAIIREYIDKQGNLVNLQEGKDNTRSFKYWPDPNEQAVHGNDLPIVRYADILLSRAEALNELNGPNPESINLINQVRGRASLEGVSLADFASKEELRDHLILERGWEFHTEAKRREDLIRMGKYIEGSVNGIAIGARDRGIETAQVYHRRVPIPQGALDANPALEQNPGYATL